MPSIISTKRAERARVRARVRALTSKNVPNFTTMGCKALLAFTREMTQAQRAEFAKLNAEATAHGGECAHRKACIATGFEEIDKLKAVQADLDKQLAVLQAAIKDRELHLRISAEILETHSRLVTNTTRVVEESRAQVQENLRRVDDYARAVKHTHARAAAAEAAFKAAGQQAEQTKADEATLARIEAVPGTATQKLIRKFDHFCGLALNRDVMSPPTTLLTEADYESE